MKKIKNKNKETIIVAVKDEESAEENLIDSPLEDGLDIASSDSLNYTLHLVAKRFGLGEDYVMTSFTDGGNSCKITLASKDFEVMVKIRDKESSEFPLLMK